MDILVLGVASSFLVCTGAHISQRLDFLTNMTFLISRHCGTSCSGLTGSRCSSAQGCMPIEVAGAGSQGEVADRAPGLVCADVIVHFGFQPAELKGQCNHLHVLVFFLFGQHTSRVQHMHDHTSDQFAGACACSDPVCGFQLFRCS
jgi:hypothetical protein